jgi:hypothetical protein
MQIFKDEAARLSGRSIEVEVVPRLRSMLKESIGAISRLVPESAVAAFPSFLKIMMRLAMPCHVLT